MLSGKLKNSGNLCLMMLCGVALSGCLGEALTFRAVTAGISAAAHGVFSDPDVNLKEKNYAAADLLVSKMSGDVSVHDIIAVKPLEEADQPGITSAFGTSIPEGVGLRFSELGYKVWLHDVATQGHEDLYPRPPEGMKEHFRLGGRYMVRKDHVDVYLRVVDVKTGAAVAYFDYQMPLSLELKKLAKTEARIFRAPQ